MDQASPSFDKYCILLKIMYNLVCLLFMNHAPRTIFSCKLDEQYGHWAQHAIEERYIKSWKQTQMEPSFRKMIACVSSTQESGEESMPSMGDSCTCSWMEPTRLNSFQPTLIRMLPLNSCLHSPRRL